MRQRIKDTRDDYSLLSVTLRMLLNKACVISFFYIFLMMIGLNTEIQAQQQVIHLWPGTVPGEVDAKQAAVVTADSSGGVKRLTDITDPVLEVFPAPAKNNTGVGVIVCPGGAYNILAVDLEGYEIAHWLNKLGYTAFVLQYRVPKKREGALQDAQRAIRIVRSRAAEWGLQPENVGMMGFSAGGSLTARAATGYNVHTYTPIDSADMLSARPAFGVLIYPAYLDRAPERRLTPELKPDRYTPPMFLFATADDPYGNSALVMAGALRDANVPAELHFYATGGHGYGLRPGNTAAEAWPVLLAEWLRRR
ncbi:alpha/beta hydrolase [Chitinophaga nivalis]|uniref:Alpha/beta hydrolase n=1 Tax=Chitinophaga nivalis TaxID=2991709 RepID=A0ABT3ILE3_9BACT|nr:alpha/beta hydrolase [Chitinophaga nivalis]MCW3465524.1 alpha/beta hydrolase [Chitinophaga nivalis]MCW3484785.1 alpha/beta hydrolase [Chitinophaga nivalis]